MDRLRVLYGYIMELLPDFRSYDNPAKVMEAERYAVDGGNWSVSPRRQLRLYTLTEAQNESLRQHTTQMDELATSWPWWRAGGVVCPDPRHRLGGGGDPQHRPACEGVEARVVPHGPRGAPPGDVRVTPDEIGDMALAVNRLSQGLARTQKFSQEVGVGRSTPRTSR